MSGVVWVEVPPINKACSKTLIDLRSITAGLELYKNDNGKYPENEVGINALIVKVGNNQPYMNKLPSDGWGKPYIYKYPSSLNKEHDFDLYSSGENKVDDGGTNDDVYLWGPYACPEPTEASKTFSNIAYNLLYIWFPLGLLYFFSKLFVIYKKRKT